MGSIALWLEMWGGGDPCWITHTQARGVDAQVRWGEKGILVQYWKLSHQIPVKDERGEPLLNSEGNKVYRTVQLERPRVFSAAVFNAEQIGGLPPLESKAPEWDCAFDDTRLGDTLVVRKLDLPIRSLRQLMETVEFVDRLPRLGTWGIAEIAPEAFQVRTKAAHGALKTQRKRM